MQSLSALDSEQPRPETEIKGKVVVWHHAILCSWTESLYGMLSEVGTGKQHYRG